MYHVCAPSAYGKREYTLNWITHQCLVIYTKLKHERGIEGWNPVDSLFIGIYEIQLWMILIFLCKVEFMNAFLNIRGQDVTSCQ